jgi:hypothetical protein
MFFAAVAVVSIAWASMSIIADIDKTSTSIANASQNTTRPDQFKDWKTYTNTKYGFEIKYPNTNWQVQGKDNLYDIRNGGAFVTIGLAGSNINTSLDDWFKKQYNYYLNIPDGNPIYAEPYNPAKITDYNFNGILVKKTRPVSFDYSGIEFFFKKGTDVLYVEYSESDGNDKTFSEKISTLNQILSTFKFIE